MNDNQQRGRERLMRMLAEYERINCEKQVNYKKTIVLPLKCLFVFRKRITIIGISLFIMLVFCMPFIHFNVNALDVCWAHPGKHLMVPNLGFSPYTHTVYCSECGLELGQEYCEDWQTRPDDCRESSRCSECNRVLVATEYTQHATTGTWYARGTQYHYSICKHKTVFGYPCEKEIVELHDFVDGICKVCGYEG
ncbi:MAG: hypothetical protein J6K63_02505 [Clostridia bacterium]|nr:hypothetical protein [Clostridia bacterium]